MSATTQDDLRLAVSTKIKLRLRMKGKLVMTSRFFSLLAIGKRFAFGFGLAAMMLPGMLSAAVSGSFGMAPVTGVVASWPLQVLE